LRSPSLPLSSFEPVPDPLCRVAGCVMAAAPTPADAKAEAAKMDLLEDDDEFEEFEIDQGTALPAALLP
jgi:hypothetical protein